MASAQRNPVLSTIDVTYPLGKKMVTVHLTEDEARTLYRDLGPLTGEDVMEDTERAALARSRDIERRQAAAYFYAAGRVDEGDYPDVSESAFAIWATDEAKAYYGGETSFLGSVSDQWQRYLRREV
jgi:hypothetical protein